jgi:DNA repair protein RadC
MEQLLNLSVLTTVAEVELIYKSRVKPSERPLANSSSKCYQLLLQT